MPKYYIEEVVVTTVEAESEDQAVQKYCDGVQSPFPTDVRAFEVYLAKEA